MTVKQIKVGPWHSYQTANNFTYVYDIRRYGQTKPKLKKASDHNHNRLHGCESSKGQRRNTMYIAGCPLDGHRSTAERAMWKRNREREREEHGITIRVYNNCLCQSHLQLHLTKRHWPTVWLRAVHTQRPCAQ